MSATGIASLTLWVRDPEGLAGFYCNALGMSRQDAGQDVAVGYGEQGAMLILRQSATDAVYAHDTADRYWKIAITLPDLDAAQAQLAGAGHAASPPHQFRDIGYLSHLADPEGHIIEFIQHTFDGAPKSAAGDPDKPLGGGAQIGLITLRTSDIAAELATCTQVGMSYLSRQAVSDRGFDLYFFAPTEERPPDADINAVGNRPWLWQRPYTVLEFQHRLSEEAIAAAPDEVPEVGVRMADGRIVTLT